MRSASQERRKELSGGQYAGSVTILSANLEAKAYSEDISVEPSSIIGHLGNRKPVMKPAYYVFGQVFILFVNIK